MPPFHGRRSLSRLWKYFRRTATFLLEHTRRISISRSRHGSRRRCSTSAGWLGRRRSCWKQWSTKPLKVRPWCRPPGRSVRPPSPLTTWTVNCARPVYYRIVPRHRTGRERREPPRTRDNCPLRALPRGRCRSIAPHMSRRRIGIPSGMLSGSYRGIAYIPAGNRECQHSRRNTSRIHGPGHIIRQ